MEWQILKEGIIHTNMNTIWCKRTLVAAWDLQDPDPNNPSKRSRQRATEKLGMGLDRRNRVSKQHILPGGKYRGM